MINIILAIMCVVLSISYIIVFAMMWEDSKMYHKLDRYFNTKRRIITCLIPFGAFFVFIGNIFNKIKTLINESN